MSHGPASVEAGACLEVNNMHIVMDRLLKVNQFQGRFCRYEKDKVKEGQVNGFLLEEMIEKMSSTPVCQKRVTRKMVAWKT